MNTGKLFAIVAIGITSLGFTSNASANQLSVEQSLTTAIVEQGQKVASDMAIQLKQQIKQEISNFSVTEIFAEEEVKDETVNSKAKETSSEDDTIEVEVE